MQLLSICSIIYRRKNIVADRALKMPAINVAFAQPPQQHLNTIHFGMAILLLLLTVYPYLFNNSNICCQVAAHDLDLKHQSIDEFEIIKARDIVWSKTIKTRDTREQLLHVPSIESGFQNELMNDLDAIPKLKTFTKNRDLPPSQRPPAPPAQPFKRVKFSSLGREFNLILGKSNHLITKNFKVVTLDSEGRETLVPFNRNDIQILEGYIDGETKSRVAASFNRQDRLMTAQIKTGQEIIMVEPTYLHKDQLLLTSAMTAATQSTSSSSSSTAASIIMNPSSSSPPEMSPISLGDGLYNETMIVYNLRDHRQFQDTSKNLFDPRQLCAAVKVGPGFSDPTTNQTLEGGRPTANAADLHDISSREGDQPAETTSKLKLRGSDRSRRGIEFTTDEGRPMRDKTRCTLHLVADYLFYKNVGNGDLQTTINYLLALINRVNQIYLPTVWATGEDEPDQNSPSLPRNIGFTVQNITIHQEYTRLSANIGDIHYNMASDRVWVAREFLDNFSKHSPQRHYCLAHLFTYRKFDTPVLGLAYVASPRFGAIGGICSPVQQKGDTLYKHNTGISTSKGITGETLITRQTDLVLAHELGHNLGAEHDSSECRPAPSDGGAYLMHPFAVMGFEKNNRFLSNCSRSSIGRVLKRKAATCFVGVLDHVCGNGIVEDDEECDGGDLGYGHGDPCCDSSCRFVPGAQCSDRHSWCCNRCHVQPAGVHCRPAEELNCKQATYCDGRSAECPASPPIEDNRTCIGGGFCRAGECKPFCEVHNLLPCMCNTPANACRLCCKASLNATCHPYNTKAPYLPDGNQCYRGICEKGRCEQPIQDVVERLWDVIEDINLTTFVKFLRDNIILVVLVCSIPVWCLITYYIDEFDRRIKRDLMRAMDNRNRRGPASQSPFLPRLFVGDEISQPDDAKADDPLAGRPLNRPPQPPPPPSSQHQRQRGGDSRNGSGFMRPPHQPGFVHRLPSYGFNLPEGEEVVFGPRHSMALNSIELPHMAANGGASANNVDSSNNEIANGDDGDNNEADAQQQQQQIPNEISGSFSTQV